MKIGKGIKRMRSKYYPGQPKIHFAHDMGISVGTLVRYESGSNVPQDFIQTLCEKLKIPLLIFYWHCIEDDDVDPYLYRKFKDEIEQMLYSMLKYDAG